MRRNATVTTQRNQESGTDNPAASTLHLGSAAVVGATTAPAHRLRNPVQRQGHHIDYNGDHSTMVHKGLALLTGLLLLVSCSSSDSPIAINKNKKGGLFESSVTGKGLSFYHSKEIIKVDTTTFISFVDFDVIRQEKSPYEGVFVLNVELNESGTLKFNEMTSRNLRKPICFVIGDKIVAAPIISEVISNGRILMMIPDKKGVELIIEYFKN